jgi:two-component system LytT family response regulator
MFNLILTFSMIQIIILSNNKTELIASKELLSCKYDIEILACISDFSSLTKLLAKYHPDIIIVEINEHNTHFFEEYANIISHFQTIIVAPTSEYAFQAIKSGVTDYYIKPLQFENIQSIIHNFYKKSYKTTPKNTLLMQQHSSQSSKIVIPTIDEYHFVNIDRIIRCHSDNYYTTIYIDDESSFIVSKTLKEYEKLLTPYNFIRPHHSHLVNFEYIKSYTPSHGGELILTDETHIPVSRRKKEIILKIIKQLQNK